MLQAQQGHLIQNHVKMYGTDVGKHTTSAQVTFLTEYQAKRHSLILQHLQLFGLKATNDVHSEQAREVLYRQSTDTHTNSVRQLIASKKYKEGNGADFEVMSNSSKAYKMYA